MSRSSDNVLQYGLLALVKALEGYTGNELQRSNEKYRSDLRRPDQDLQRQKTLSEISATDALTRQRGASAQRQLTPKAPKETDPLEGLLKDISISGNARMGVRSLVTDSLAQGNQDYDKAAEAIQARLDSKAIDKEFPPLPGPDTPEGIMLSSQERENARKMRQQHINSLTSAHTILQALKARRLAGEAGAPAGAAGPMQGAPQAMGPQQAPVGGPGSLPPVGTDEELPQGLSQLPRLQPGGAAGQMGGSAVTPPRMPPDHMAIANQNRQTMMQAPQGAGANQQDAINSGDAAWAFSIIEQSKHDQRVPFEHQAHAWFIANKVMGVPIPDPFRQYLTSQGIPREVLDSGPLPLSYMQRGPASRPQKPASRPDALPYRERR